MERKIIQSLYDVYRRSYRVSTDTRKLEPGCVFFALKGPNFNANEFAQEALKKGASLAVVDESQYAKDDRYILVDNALEALQDLARYHRNQLDIPVIGLTGSNGKTTSKELIDRVLRTKYRVYATQGNLNNHIGVPLSILQVTPEVEIAVIEMGANRVGDIFFLCSISNPTHGFITNIGKAHIGTFGGYENIIRGKSELYHHLIQHNGTVWINSGDPVLSNMAKRFKNPYFYPAAGDFFHCELVSSDPFVVYRDEAGNTIHTGLIGEYNFGNIAVALCIGKFFEVDSAKANQAVADYAPENNRSQVIRRGTNTIILDAYNANPSSMEAALHNLRQMDAKNKVVILGDMNELGDDSIEEHQKLVEQISQMDLEETILVGEIIKGPAASKELTWFSQTAEVIPYLEKTSFSDTVFLIKASRSIGLEKVLDAIK